MLSVSLARSPVGRRGLAVAGACARGPAGRSRGCTLQLQALPGRCPACGAGSRLGAGAWAAHIKPYTAEKLYASLEQPTFLHT